MARSDKRKGPAEDALIEAAERIFGTQGIERASLRAIAHAAGSANSSAVQYHFGDREGLVQAIFDRRLAEIEAKRRAMVRDQGLPTQVRDWVALIARPLIEQRDTHGKHSYAGFLLGLRRSDEGLAPRLLRAGQAPFAAAAIAAIRGAAPVIGDAAFEFRVDTFSAMLLDAIDRFDRGDPGCPDDSHLLNRVIDVGTAILLAPET